jgi:hypothetical protein
MKLAEIEIRNIFENADIEEHQFIIRDDIANGLLEDTYDELETIQNDILEYIDDDINILNYNITDEDYQQLNTLIETLWNEYD